MQVRKYFGPPGTGKTETLLLLVEQELQQGVSPERIAYLSFTNVACDEARIRAANKFQLDKKALRWFRTLHSICYRLLNVSRPQMITKPRDLAAFGELVGYRFSEKRSYAESDDYDFGYAGPGNRLVEFDHYRRSRLQLVDEAYAAWPELFTNLEETQRFTAAYEGYRRDEGLLDFTDLLERVHEPLDVDVMFVDEAQDLSRLQWAALRQISRRVSRLYVAGDDDQAIFTWAGASPDAFVRSPGEAVVLQQSFRVPRAVYEVAIRLVDGLPDRQLKAWRPRQGEGTVVSLLGVKSALETLPEIGSVLVLYRSHYQIREVETELRKLGLPYQTIWGLARGLEWGWAIRHWERLRAEKVITVTDALGVLRAIDLVDEDRRIVRILEGRNGQDPLTLVQLRDLGLPVKVKGPWQKALTKIKSKDGEYLRRVIANHQAAGLTNVPRIRISTIHSAKGAEADHVLLLTEQSQRCKRLLTSHPGTEERVFYVGVTRARESLMLVGSGENRLFPALNRLSDP